MMAISSSSTRALASALCSAVPVFRAFLKKLGPRPPPLDDHRRGVAVHRVLVGFGLLSPPTGGTVVLRSTKTKAYYPGKERPDNKIDGIVAALMALSRALLR